MEDNKRCYTDLKLQDEKNKQTIVEQKVSIRVMTSFELKVQNNASLAVDNDNSKQKNGQEKVLSNFGTSNILKNIVKDTGEMIRKKTNVFTPTPLENISEGFKFKIFFFFHFYTYTICRMNVLYNKNSYLNKPKQRFFVATKK